jgi:glutaconyl-CoA decarboxylase
MRLRLVVDGEPHEVVLEPGRVTVDGEPYEARAAGSGPFEVRVGERTLRVEVRAGEAVVEGEPVRFQAEVLPPASVGHAPASRAGPVHPPMPGRIVEVRVRAGQEVQAGQVLVVLEAMKMQNEVPAPAAGTVREVKVREGQLVEARDVLVELG